MSKPQCRPGDLAVVVFPENLVNLGCIVKVVKPDAGEAGFTFSAQFGPVWWCSSSHTMTWRLGGETKLMSSGPIPDRCLLPIRPNGDDLATSLSKVTDAALQRESAKDTQRKPLEPVSLHLVEEV